MMKEYGDWYKKSYEIKKRYLALFFAAGLRSFDNDVLGNRDHDLVIGGDHEL